MLDYRILLTTRYREFLRLIKKSTEIYTPDFYRFYICTNKPQSAHDYYGALNAIGEDIKASLNIEKFDILKPLPSEVDKGMIAEAARKTMPEWLNDAEKYSRDFYRYVKLTLKAKRMYTEDILSGFEAQKENPVRFIVGGWKFGYRSLLFEKKGDSICEEFRAFSNKRRRGEARLYMFENSVGVALEDTGKDDYSEIEAINYTSSLMPYIQTLKEFEVINTYETHGFLSENLETFLFEALSRCVRYIKENSTRPAEIKNTIAKEVDESGRSDGGIFVQILFLQGLLRWLELSSLKKGDTGYIETGLLHKWVQDILFYYLICFTVTPFNKEIKALLDPFCAFISQIPTGKRVQAYLFGKDEQRTGKEPQRPKIELSKEEKKYYGLAIKKGFAEKTETGYRWKGNKVSLAYFLCRIFNPDGTKAVPFKRLNELWGVSRLDSSYSRYLYRKKAPKWQDEIDNIFHS